MPENEVFAVKDLTSSIEPDNISLLMIWLVFEDTPRLHLEMIDFALFFLIYL
jgi:hypothetical protein